MFTASISYVCLLEKPGTCCHVVIICSSLLCVSALLFDFIVLIPCESFVHYLLCVMFIAIALLQEAWNSGDAYGQSTYLYQDSAGLRIHKTESPESSSDFLRLLWV